MKALPFDVLLSWILGELEERQSIFGIHRSLFYAPGKGRPYAIHSMFGHFLATPIGPAAGPHTQLAQNIVCAWLSGGRFIELKTVQIMDELEIPRPCIDMEDEGYNVEWSQELKLSQSAGEYIKAWVLIHILHRLLGFEGIVPVGTVFNMSVGYNLEGIQSDPMTRFMDRLKDASPMLCGIRSAMRKQFPQFADIEIPPQVSNNVTLSTMHGCPPDEIEKIARYLLEERGLHTTVKLNPTLLGRERVLSILHGRLGYHEIRIPETVFKQDLQYPRAVELIRSLRQAAARRSLTFGVKLSNTLALANHKRKLPGDEMYMSGRALYPLTMNLFRVLADDFNGDLNVSYAAGADAHNVTAVLACGARPVTVASDLLKPGGYSRFLQYLEIIETELRVRGAASLDELAKNRLDNLRESADEALRNPRYKKNYFGNVLPKVVSGLGLFDCISAPCVEQCAICQDVPEYAWLIARGDYDRALEVILYRNPLPGVTGYVCTHLCQSRCTRSASNYEEPVAIRALKRVAAERGRVSLLAKQMINRKVAVVGSGPSGLSAAYFLALNGIRTTIFEAGNGIGGMLRLAPVFRLPEAIIKQDVDRIIEMGVEIKLESPITAPPEDLLKNGFDAVYIASGFQSDTALNLGGMGGEGVMGALDMLRRVQQGARVNLGSRVLVIGGGDTALDAARVAKRLTGNPPTIVYRRSRAEMPAGEEDKNDAFEEGIVLEELASPTRIVLKDGRVVALECVRNRLAEPGSDGRRQPVSIEGSEFQIAADSIIVGVGQSPDNEFLRGSTIRLGRNGSIVVSPGSGYAGTPHVYAGGDAVRGPESIIAACADGRRAAESICADFGVEFRQPLPRPAKLSEDEIVRVKRVRARKETQLKPERIAPTRRSGFELIESTLADDAARREATRCLQCSTFCDKCVEVCPNRANYSYQLTPAALRLPKISCQDGVARVTGEEIFRISQDRQIIHLHDLCNDCGNCATFCVHQGRPYGEKPRLFFQNEDFEQEHDNAFHIHREKGDWVIRRREGGKPSTLGLNIDSGEMFFSNRLLNVIFSAADFRIKKVDLVEQFVGEVSLVEAAEMYAILQGIIGSLSFIHFEHGRDVAPGTMP